MKVSLFLLFLFAVSALFSSCSEQKVSEGDKVLLRNAGIAFMKELKGVLVAEMSSKGPVHAASVCSDTAQYLTVKISEELGVEIKRVSEKFRNPVNQPDETDLEALNYFMELKAQGKLNPQAEIIKEASENGIEKIKLYKPLVVGGECLVCHGKGNEISPEVAKVINKNYPQDKARDYSIGDLRGAVVAAKSL